MTVRYETADYLIGEVKCDDCEDIEEFGLDDDLYNEADIRAEFRDRGWYMPEADEESQDLLCPRCATEEGLALQARNARELNGRPLYSYAELGMSEAVL